MTLARIWECTFCDAHITEQLETGSAADMLAGDPFPAIVNEQLVRDHFRTAHPKIWPMVKRLGEEIQAGLESAVQR